MKRSLLSQVPGLCVWVTLGLMSCAHFAMGQTTVSGKVVSLIDNTSMPGVNILIKGTTKGTTTNAEGLYTIEVPDGNAVLVFSFIGFQTEEVVVGTQSSINVSLPPSLEQLAEVVVVGYGTQKRADLTGAIGGIRGDAVGISSKAITSADQILAGRVAGVNISNRSGDPGAPINVRIRGVGTTGNNQPLWVIDGMPIVQTSNITVNTSSVTESNPLAGINPSDIESIDVLKDASAAAIYGSRAANGVIIVTTKRGKEGKATVNYDGFVGFGQVRKKMDMLNVKEYVDIQAQLGRDFSEFANNPTVDWQDAVFRTSTIENHNISITGGTPAVNYSIGGGYVNQDGIEQSQGFKRYSLKANTDAKVGKKLRFGESLILSQVERTVQSEDAVSSVQSFSSAAVNAAINSPYYQIYDPNGPFGYNPENAETLGPDGYGINLLARTDPRVANTNVINRKVLGTVYGELEIVKGLKYKITGSLDYNNGGGDYFQEAVALDNITKRPSLLTQERATELTTNFANTLTYDASFGKHNITLLAGHEETNFKYEKVRVQGTDLFNSKIRFGSVATNIAASNEADHWALRGFLGRINYAFADKYLLTFNVRNDNTSRFKEGNRSQTFPSVSGGWRISEEKFFPKGPVFDDFKIRASWGRSGNQFTGVNFAYLSTLPTTIFYPIGTGQTIRRAAAPVVMANPNLKWETSTQVDIGADITLFKGTVDVTFDYYRKISEGVLVPLPLPMSSGFFLAVDANGGKILNRGIELALNYHGTLGQVTYTVGGNITTVHNEVLELNGVTDIVTGVQGAQTHRTAVGEPLGFFYGYKTDGIFQTQEEIDAAVPDNISGGREPGDIRFKDVNGDHVIDDGDRTNIGSSIPKYFYGINLSVNYKNFDLSLLFQGVGGVQVYNASRSILENLAFNNNFSRSTLSHWHGAGTSNSMPRLVADDPNGNNRYSDRWIEDADFLRFKNLQLGYNLPGDKVKGWSRGFIERFRVYVAAQNLYTFTNYKGYDPEVTRGFSFQKGDLSLANGQDSGNSPQPRFIQFGWQLTF
jgi:TonB-dependent starch-binding outer membrane protein SusC